MPHEIFVCSSETMSKQQSATPTIPCAVGLRGALSYYRLAISLAVSRCGAWATNAIITRDQMKILPMPDLVITHITSLAASESFIRGIDPDVGALESKIDDDRDMHLAAPLPDMMAIGDRDGDVQLADHYAIAPDAGVYSDGAVQGTLQHDDDQRTADIDDNNSTDAQQHALSSSQTPTPTPTPTKYLPAKRHGRGVDSLQSLRSNSNSSTQRSMRRGHTSDHG